MPQGTYQIHSPSGSSNFLPINIAATTSASPTVIHTSDTVNYDELWLSAYCYGANDTVLYLMLGGNNPHQIISLVIPSQRGIVSVLNGQTFTGGVIISAYASETNSISLIGRVNRIVFI